MLPFPRPVLTIWLLLLPFLRLIFVLFFVPLKPFPRLFSASLAQFLLLFLPFHLLFLPFHLLLFYFPLLWLAVLQLLLLLPLLWLAVLQLLLHIRPSIALSNRLLLLPILPSFLLFSFPLLSFLLLQNVFHLLIYLTYLLLFPLLLDLSSAFPLFYGSIPLFFLLDLEIPSIRTLNVALLFHLLAFHFYLFLIGILYSIAHLPYNLDHTV